MNDSDFATNQERVNTYARLRSDVARIDASIASLNASGLNPLRSIMFGEGEANNQSFIPFDGSDIKMDSISHILVTLLQERKADIQAQMELL